MFTLAAADNVSRAQSDLRQSKFGVLSRRFLIQVLQRSKARGGHTPATGCAARQGPVKAQRSFLAMARRADQILHKAMPFDAHAAQRLQRGSNRRGFRLAPPWPKIPGAMIEAAPWIAPARGSPKYVIPRIE
jgi:hypothetical protein